MPDDDYDDQGVQETGQDPFDWDPSQEGSQEQDTGFDPVDDPGYDPDNWG